MKRIASLILFSSGVLAGNGCALRHHDNTTLGTDEADLLSDGNAGTSTGDTAAETAALPILGIDKVEHVMTVDAAAEASLASRSFFKPAGCATSERVGNVVTHTFVHCTGPFGRHVIDGKIIATFTNANAGGIDVESHGDGLSIDGSPATMTSHGHITFESGVRTFVHDGEWSGTSLKGFAVHHVGHHVVTFDPATQCVSRDGNGTTTVSRPEGDRVHTHSISGYVRCDDACPKSGTLVWTNAKGLSLKLEFLPDGEAQLTTRRGRVFDIPLFCSAS